jgi:hypothetical protein
MQPAKTSQMAIWSMILGLLTLPLAFVYVGLLTGVLAIVFGIIGISAISGSAGRLKGKGMAWTGIVSTVVALCAYGGFVVWAKQQADEIPETQRQQNNTLSAAEAKVMGDSQGAAFGNDAKAAKLAKDFSAMMKTKHEELFTREGKTPAVQLSGGEFATYCHLGESGCVFIVHSPSHRKPPGDAQKSLSDIAWMVASSVTSELPKGTPLAVGLRGTFVYGSVMTGKTGKDDPEKMDGDRNTLMPFFGKDKPKGEPQAKPKTEPKGEPQTKPKTEPKTEPKEEPQTKPKKEQQSEPKSAPKNAPPSKDNQDSSS